MKKIKYPISLALIFVLIMAAFTGCKKEEELTTVRLNEVVHSIFYAPQYVALEKGFFKEEGLNVEVTIGQGADKSMTALIANSADIALLGTEAGIYVYNEGKENHPISFAQLTQRAGNFLVSRTDDKDFKWEDVKGKSIIGGRIGGMPELVLEYVLKERGIEPGKDMEIINNIAYTSTSGAFVGEVGDYTAEFEPAASAIEAQGNGFVVASLGEASGYIPYTVYMANKDYMSKNPEIIQKFTNAIYKGQLWVDSHTSKEIAEVIAPQFKESDIPTLEKIVDRYKSQDTWKTNTVFDEEGFNLIQDIMEKGGELDKRVPYAEFVNTDFANKAIEAVK